MKKNKYLLVSVIVFILAVFSFYNGNEHNNNVACADSLSETSQKPCISFADVSSVSGMSIYMPRFNSVELACGQRPSMNDVSVAYCAEAATVQIDVFNKPRKGIHCGTATFFTEKATDF